MNLHWMHRPNAISLVRGIPVTWLRKDVHC